MMTPDSKIETSQRVGPVAPWFGGICDGCGKHSERLTAVDWAPAAGLAVCDECAPRVLWSQAFADDYHHAIHAADHDPRASGWIAICGAFCCGEPFRAADSQGREACPRCLRLSEPNQGVVPVQVHALAQIVAGSFGNDRLTLSNEFSLHDELARRLTAKGVPFNREVRLGRRKRPDFMVGAIAIEIKIDGGELAVLRQLKRYADDPTVAGIILLTTRKIGHPVTLTNKPVASVCLWKNLL